MKKVMVVNPFGTVYGSGILGPSIPTGLLYLTAYLKNKGVEVKFFDALAEGRDRLVKKGKGRSCGVSEARMKRELKKFKPDLVGIGCMFTAYFDDVVEMARIVKEFDKNIMVVIGGSHVSIDPVEAASSQWVDVAVYGEGEISLWELVSGKKLDTVRGIVYKKGKKMIKNKPRPLIENLDRLPFPAWEELDLSLYGLGGVFNMRDRVFPIVSSRGCPGRCLYCSVNMVWQHRWRGRSAKNVVDEMEMLIDDYGANEFAFQDDSLSVDKRRLGQICDEIIERKLDIKWTTPNGIAHWALDKRLLVKMKKAGCYRITFGIESGDMALRKWMGKPYSLKQAKDLIVYANSLGMWTLTTNIIGFPYETEKQMEKTLKYAIESEVDLAFFFRLGPRPGTIIYQIFEKEGWLMKDRHLLFSEDVACQTKYFSGDERVEKQNQLYRRFLTKRWLRLSSLSRVAGKIKSWEDLRYILRVTMAGLRLGFNLLSAKVAVTSKTLST